MKTNKEKKLEEWLRLREERELAWKTLKEKHSPSKRKKEAKKKAKKERAKEAIRKMPYKEYIVSDIWKVRREVMIESQSNKCEICNSTENLSVHHNNYNTRGEEKDTDLIVVCWPCHKEFHKVNIVARDKGDRRYIHGQYDSRYVHVTPFVQPHEHRCCMCAWKPVVCILGKEKKTRSLKFCTDCYELFLPKMEKGSHLCMETIQEYTPQRGLREEMTRFGY